MPRCLARRATRRMPETISSVLTWTDASEVHGRMLSGHAALLAKRYEEKLERFRRAGIGGRLTALSESLPKGALSVMQMAPESVCKLLYEPEHFSHLLSSLIAEHRRLGNAVEPRDSVWTALGDSYFPGNGGSAVPFEAPRLSNGIPVDYESPQVDTSIGLASGGYHKLTRCEAELGVEKLESALSGIGQASPEVRCLLDAYVRVIVVRGGEPRNTFASASYDNYIGKMAFCNLDSDAVPQARIMDGMVHEAIHAFLYVREEEQPYFSHREAANALVAVSPWSGRTLPVHSFFHACYVWFGLWQFWRRALKAGFQDETAVQLFQRARDGFFHPELPSRMTALSQHLTLEARRVEDLVREVRAGQYGDEHE